jgi:hypothetical protein
MGVVPPPTLDSGASPQDLRGLRSLLITASIRPVRISCGLLKVQGKQPGEQIVMADLMWPPISVEYGSIEGFWASVSQVGGSLYRFVSVLNTRSSSATPAGVNQPVRSRSNRFAIARPSRLLRQIRLSGIIAGSNPEDGHSYRA